MKTLLRKAAPSALKMIRMDHTHVLATFHQYDVDASPQTKQAIVKTACLALEIHSQLEEEILYPALRATQAANVIVEKNLPEHEEIRRLIGLLRGMEPTDPSFDDTFMDLMRNVMHHVADEETRLLPEAQRLLGSQLDDLGARMLKRRFELTAPRAREIAVNTARAAPAASIALTAAAVIAGGYLARRALIRRS